MKYLFALILLSSCYTAKKAEKQLDKAIAEYPAMAAEKTRDRFPCITTAETVRTDTVYELIDVECPPSGIDTFKTVITVPDTVYKDRLTILKAGKQTVYIPAKTVTVTKYIEDSAKIFLAIKDKEKAVKEYEDEHDRRKSLLMWFWWLLLAFIVSLVLHYLRFKKWL